MDIFYLKMLKYYSWSGVLNGNYVKFDLKEHSLVCLFYQRLKHTSQQFSTKTMLLKCSYMPGVFQKFDMVTYWYMFLEVMLYRVKSNTLQSENQPGRYPCIGIFAFIGFDLCQC